MNLRFALTCAVFSLQLASAFMNVPLAGQRALLSTGIVIPQRDSVPNLRVHMQEMGDKSASPRRVFLQTAGQAAMVAMGVGSSVANPSAALAAKGEWARIDMTGKKGVSGLGENDLPAAGKIDPYEDREKANQEYAVRMQDPARIAQKREEAMALKEKIMVAVTGAIERKDWKEAKLVLTRDTLPLRRAMNEASTKGARAVSAAQRGGDPEKSKTEVEKAEKDFLMSVNRLAVGLDGERTRVDFGKVVKVAQKAEDDWQRWLALSE
eukprot:CAMPEP_0196719488 /NCGR_PEP_ID=MMETSP1091-20130531/2443_1 /TAXON_ID=302021 /ORGANISM="Rhodomonas sp., Strain CCMP768" /LENGTH=265 /DNA_ID=CAMNT_0042060447 /DNA_START=12 /DNA_END=809 /DNA_ORIENTATION=+